MVLGGAGNQGPSYGGGAAIISVAGESTINGSISSNGTWTWYFGGSGGSVQLTTGSISGSGNIYANGATGQSGQFGGSGGRVSIILTGPGQNFSNYSGLATAYGNGVLTAYNSSAGTVYLQTGDQTSGQGSLIIDNNNLASAAGTYTDLASNSLTSLSSLQVNNAANFTYQGAPTLSFGTPSLSTPTVSGSVNAIFNVLKALTIPGTNTFYGTLNASTTNITYTGFAGASTTVAVLPGTYGNFITENVTTGITYQLSGNLVNLTSYVIPCGVTIDLNGYNYQGTMDFSTNAGCGARLVYNGGSLNGVGEAGGVVLQCTATGNIAGGSYSSYTITNGATCTLTGHVNLSANLIINNSSTLVTNGFSVKAQNFTNNGTLRMVGNEVINVLGTVSNSGTVEYRGAAANSFADRYLLKNLSYNHLTTNFTDTNDSVDGSYIQSVNSGLVGYWRFDETATPAADSSGYNHNGVWTGSASYQASLPPLIKFYNPRTSSLNGTSAYYNLSNPTALQLTEDLSISAWVKRSATGGTRTIIGRGNGGYVFGFDSSNKLAFSKKGSPAVVSNSTITNTTNWYHVAVTYDGEDVRFYINGVLDSTESFSETFSSSNNVYIGNDSSASEFFNGWMDEVRIYNRALTDEEVSSLAEGHSGEGTLTPLTVSGNHTITAGTFIAPNTMTITGNHSQTGGTFVASSTLNINGNYTQSGASSFVRNQGMVNLTKTNGTQTITSTTSLSFAPYGLVGYWKFDNGSGTSATDSSGYGNTGTLVNSPVWSATVPAEIKFTDPYSLSLNGSGQYSTIGTSLLNNPSSQTISAWLYVNSLPSFGTGNYALFPSILSKGSTYISFGYDNLGKIFGFYYNNLNSSISSIISSSSINVGSWQHVAWVWDNTSSKLYLNGSEVYSGSSIGPGYNLNVGHLNGAVRSGMGPIGGSVGINGRLDDLRVYNRALSVDEISNLAEGNNSNEGGNTFHSLSKTTANSTLSITAGHTITTTGTTTLKGNSSSQLTIASTNVGGTQWKFDPQGPLDLAYLNVKDSNNINASTTNTRPLIEASNFTGVSDQGNNTNWTFVLPVITITATGTQQATTTLPTTGKYMGGSFMATSTVEGSIITAIGLTQIGSLPTNYISNVALYYGTTTDDTCSDTAHLPAGLTLFGNTSTWVNNHATTTGSMIIGTSPVCIYTQYNLTGTANDITLFSTVDLEITNPSTDIVSTGATIIPGTTIDVPGSTVVVSGGVAVPTISLTVASSSMVNDSATTLTWSVGNNPTSCTATGDNGTGGGWTAGSKPFTGTTTTGTLPLHKTYTFSLSCYNSFGTSTAYANVGITDPRAPTVSLSASPSVVDSGDNSNISWTTTSGSINDETTCTTTGTDNNWDGGEVLNPSPTNTGSVNDTNITSNVWYKISCTNDYGTTARTAYVNLTATLPHCSNGIKDSDETGVDYGGSCELVGGTNSTVSYGDYFITSMPDGSSVRFFFMSQGAGYGLYMRTVNGTDVVTRKLTASDLSVTNARPGEGAFIGFDCDQNSCRRLKIELKVQKVSQDGSLSNYSYEKTFRTTSVVRAN